MFLAVLFVVVFVVVVVIRAAVVVMTVVLVDFRVLCQSKGQGVVSKVCQS